VKQIFEKNYRVRINLYHYACPMFSSRQGASDIILSWSSRIDTMQSELRETAHRICDDDAIDAMGLINHLAKAYFLQWLRNERIQNITRSKGNTALLSPCIDAGIQEKLIIRR